LTFGVARLPSMKSGIFSALATVWAGWFMGLAFQFG
jgi:hypothetical protein